jgi:hypothetical protein
MGVREDETTTASPHAGVRSYRLVDSPARLFRRYAQSLPCVSEPRRRYTEEALNAVDFSRPASIQAALGRITQLGRVDRFFDRALHGKSKAASLLAFAILALYKHADAQHEDAVRQLTDFIHESFSAETLISRERVVMLLGGMSLGDGESRPAANH